MKQNKKHTNAIINTLLSLTVILFGFNATASYLSLNETGEIMPDHYYKIGISPQLLLSNGGGLNTSVFVDTHLFQDVDGRIQMGTGKVDFFSQVSLKWVPFPDVDKQPAMGLRGAIGYARDEDLNFFNIQVTPIISKKTETNYGNMIPYAGLPVTYSSTKDSSVTSTQFAIGGEWFPKNDFHIGAEFDFNLSKSFSAVSIYLGFPFESSTGYKKQ